MTSAKDDYNPFEDPSIKVLTNQSTNNQDSVGTYNPFDKNISNKQWNREIEFKSQTNRRKKNQSHRKDVCEKIYQIFTEKMN
ncbi:hypothetical protein TNIN_185131 [Trichonephila inaurata madagascariensis]|uniref:Uncharacterized protein n=1 Tax=Trichonephila inaurata madagascariensis TaxID=2747483 RepID=A0A8X6IZN4_9ARAC|nr:hypothetical protein TNIN_185131 [Trichonephila inaurata madagascariensis]